MSEDAMKKPLGTPILCLILDQVGQSKYLPGMDMVMGYH